MSKMLLLLLIAGTATTSHARVTRSCAGFINAFYDIFNDNGSTLGSGRFEQNVASFTGTASAPASKNKARSRARSRLQSCFTSIRAIDDTPLLKGFPASCLTSSIKRSTSSGDADFNMFCETVDKICDKLRVDGLDDKPFGNVQLQFRTAGDTNCGSTTVTQYIQFASCDATYRSFIGC